MRWLTPVLLSLILWNGSAIAGVEECQTALDDFQSAQSDAESAAISYGNCLSGSDGSDDCGFEFSALQSAQSDFETAISNYHSECE